MSRRLQDAVDAGELMSWVPELGPGRCVERQLFVTKAFAAWARSIPVDRAKRRLSLFAARQELSVIAADFVAGERVIALVQNVTPPKRHFGILKMKTPSLRLVGWCPAAQVIVLSRGALADETHGGGTRLSDMGTEALAERKALGFTEWENGEIYELFRARR